ncbi:MAG: BamA/TamA family outer membrane protein [Planctomycetota bacterium]
MPTTRPAQRAGWFALLIAAAAGSASAAPDVWYRYGVVVEPDTGEVRVRGVVSVRNPGEEPVSHLPLVLYPNRFAELDPAITDVNVDRYYVRFFDWGHARLDALRRRGGGSVVTSPHPAPALPEGVALDVALDPPLEPGGRVDLELEYSAYVPERLGSFGRYDGRWILEGGWLPYVPALDADGERNPMRPPAQAIYDLKLEVDWPDPERPRSVLLDGQPIQSGAELRFEGSSPSLALGERLYALAEADPKTRAPGVRVYGSEGDGERAQRLVELAQNAGRWLRQQFPESGEAPGEVLFVEAPLRDRNLVVADKVIFYSERIFDVFVLLEGLIDVEVWRGVMQSLIRQDLDAIPQGGDQDWIAEALAWYAVQSWAQDRGGLEGSDIREALTWLDWIPSVDQILRAPKFPDSGVYFGYFYENWVSVPDAFARSLWRRQRGRVVLEKLREKLSDEELEALVRDSLGAEGPSPSFRERAQALNPDLDRDFFGLWLGPIPQENVLVEDVEELEELPDGRVRVRVKVRREGDPRVRLVGEPVVVQGEDAQGQPVQAIWEGKGPEGEVELEVDDGVFSAIRLDPGFRIAQAFRGDDRSPVLPKFLLNRFSARVDLNNGNRNEVEAGITLFPFRSYADRILLDGFVQEDERGVSVAYAHGFGFFIDERTFGMGLRTGLTLQEVNAGVLRDRTTLVESEGTLASASLGFGFDTRQYSVDPTAGFGVGFGMEYSDKVFGTEFRFLSLSGSSAFVTQLWRGTHVGAEVVWGQIEGSDVPTQRLFDAGGETTVRGVQTSRFVDRSLFVVRTELRHHVFTDMNFPLLWLSWLRKMQVVLFLDAGDVGESVDRVIKDANDWKWGTGFGFRCFVDVFGVTNVTLRFDVGFRIDETDELGPEYYFGLSQSF